MTAYSALARWYDRLMGDFDYDGYLRFLDGKLCGSGVDLACGTGRMTVELASAGLDVIGADVSAEMLNVAVNNAAERGVSATWVACNMKTFSPAEKKDFCVCVCDGFNYLTPASLKRTIARIAGWLKKGGRLVFDVSSEHKLRDVIGDNMFFEEYEDLSYFWDNRFAKGACDMRLVFFERKESGLYERYEEEHRQYAHPREYIESCLPGLFDHSVSDGADFGRARKNSERLLFDCIRR